MVAGSVPCFMSVFYVEWNEIPVIFTLRLLYCMQQQPRRVCDAFDSGNSFAAICELRNLRT